MNIKEEVKEEILSFNGPFTIGEIIQTLRDKEILNEDNKETVIRIIKEILESSLVFPITSTGKFYIRNVQKTW